jgi:hypothetical protein
MNIYLSGTEILDPKYLLLDRYSELEPSRFEDNKYIILNLNPIFFKI